METKTGQMTTSDANIPEAHTNVADDDTLVKDKLKSLHDLLVHLVPIKSLNEQLFEYLLDHQLPPDTRGLIQHEIVNLLDMLNEWKQSLVNLLEYSKNSLKTPPMPER